MRQVTSPAYQADPAEILTEKLALRIYHGRVTPTDMRYGVLLCALANWPKLEQFYRADLRYASAEALNVIEFWQRKITAQAKRRTR